MITSFSDKNNLVDTLHNLPKHHVDIFVEDLLMEHGINMENYIDRYIKAETENDEPIPNNSFYFNIKNHIPNMVNVVEK